MADPLYLSQTDALGVYQQQNVDRLRAEQQYYAQMQAEVEAKALADAQAIAARKQAIIDEQARRDALIREQALAQQQQAPQGEPDVEQEPTAAPNEARDFGAWNAYKNGEFFQKYLPALKILGQPGDVSNFATLPFDERKKIVDKFLDESAVAKKWTPAELETYKKSGDGLVYADNGGKKPGVLSKLGDTWDSLQGGLEQGMYSAAAGVAGMVGEDKANAVREFAKERKAAEVEDLNANTKDVLRQKAFRDTTRKLENKDKSAWDAAKEFGSDLLNAPGATVGGLVGGSIPAVATAIATRGRSIPAQLAGGGAIATYSMAGANEGTYQALMNETYKGPEWDALLAKTGGDAVKAKELIARTGANDSKALLAQGTSALVDTVGSYVGVEGAVSKLLANSATKEATKLAAIKAAAASLGSEFTEGAAASVAQNVATNAGKQATGKDVGLMDNTGAVLVEGGLQEVVGGAAILGGARAGNALVGGVQDYRANKAQPVEADPALPDPNQLQLPAPPIVTPPSVVATDVPQPPAGQQAAPGTNTVQYVQPPESFQTPEQAYDYVANLTPEVKTRMEDLFGTHANDMTKAELEQAGVVFSPKVVNVVGPTPAALTGSTPLVPPASVDSTLVAQPTPAPQGPGLSAPSVSTVSTPLPTPVPAPPTFTGTAPTKLPDGALLMTSIATGAPLSSVLRETANNSNGVTKNLLEWLIDKTSNVGLNVTQDRTIGNNDIQFTNDAGTIWSFNKKTRSAVSSSDPASIGSATTVFVDPSVAAQISSLPANFAVDEDMGNGVLVRRQANNRLADRAIGAYSQIPQAGLVPINLGGQGYKRSVGTPIRTITDMSQRTVRGATLRKPNGEMQVVLHPSNGMTVETLTHEAVHVATLNAFDADPNALTPLQQAAMSDLNSLYADAINTGMIDRFNIPNVREYVSEMLSNPDMQAEAKATVWDGPISVWGKFVESLRGLLGLPSTVPTTVFEVAVSAVDALTRDMAGGAMRNAPSGPADMATYASAPNATPSPAPTKPPKADLYAARYEADPSDVMRGSAYFDSVTGKWNAEFFLDNGNVGRAVLNNEKDAKDWLARFVHTNTPDGRRTKAFVSKEFVNSQTESNFGRILTELDKYSPGTLKMYNLLRILKVPQQAALNLISIKEFGVRMWGSRYSPVNSTGFVNAAGNNAATHILTQKAAGRAERGSNGFGKMSFADHSNNVKTFMKQATDMGVPDSVMEDWLYANYAMQRNQFNTDKYFYDEAGRPGTRDGDFAKFNYYKDGTGKIVPVPANGAKPLNGTLVAGKDAADQFIKQFQRQVSPAALQAATNALDALRVANRYASRLMLAKGAIDGTEYGNALQLDLYLPLRQLDDNGNPLASGVFRGRRTKAEAPFAQWQSVMAARVENAYYKGALRDVAMHFMNHPNPSMVELNGIDRKLAQSTELDPLLGLLPEDAITRMKSDWINDKTFVVNMGNKKLRVTLHNEAMAAALRPTARSEANQTALQAFGITNMFFTSLRTTFNPAFWFKALAWDVVAPMLSFQGAFSNGNSTLSATEGFKLAGKAILTNFIPSMKDSLKRNMTDASGVSTFTTNDPVRELYNANGGGINLTFNLSASEIADNNRSSNPVASAPSKLLHAVGAVGHVSSDAMRFAAFKAFLEHHNGGKFADKAALLAFTQANPALVEQATVGSKKLLGNFEQMGQSAWTRALVPYFGASMVGATQVVPMLLKSTQGRIGLGAITGFAMMLAMGALSDKDDEDTDGFSKFMRNPKSWEGLATGDGFVFPLMHELRPAVALGYMLAWATSDREIDEEAATTQVFKAMRSAVMPIPGADSYISDRNMLGDLGIVGNLMIAAGENDNYGRPRTSSEARKNPQDPYYLNPRSNDSSAAVSTSEMLHSELGINVAPGTIDLLEATFGGSLAILHRDVNNAEAKGSDAGSAILDWFVKGYDVGKGNEYAAKDLFEARAANVNTSPEPERRQAFKDTQAVVDTLRRETKASELARARAQALREGNSEAYLDADTQLKELAGKTGGAYKVLYDNLNRNILEAPSVSEVR